ncbi:MAG TPA: hypothetical protein V6D21_01925 [Candidatus Obscuribacterales bacterium]
MANHLKSDPLIFWLVLGGVVCSYGCLSKYTRISAHKDALVLGLSAASVGFSITAYKRNQRNKDVELYLQLSKSAIDAKVADEITATELVNQKQQEIQLNVEMIKLEGIQANLQARLEEFQ